MSPQPFYLNLTPEVEFRVEREDSQNKPYSTYKLIELSEILLSEKEYKNKNEAYEIRRVILNDQLSKLKLKILIEN